MTLSADYWKKLPVQTVVVSTMANILDAIWAALGSGSVTYYDGSTRTPGSDKAATWTRYQNAGTTEALYATPNSTTLNIRWMLAGVNAARTPLMRTPDTYSNNVLMATIVKNAGAFASWDHATQPFTSGSPFGFWKVFAGSLTALNIYCWERQGGVRVFIEDILGAVYGCQICDFDPESSDVTVDAESDGKLYGLYVKGTATAISATFNTGGGTGTSADVWTSHSTTASNAHAGAFTPGASTVVTLYRCPQGVSTNVSLRSKSGRYYRVPHLLYDRADDRFFGRDREVCFGVDGLLNGIYTESGTDVAYLAGGSSTVVQDCDWLIAS